MRTNPAKSIFEVFEGARRRDTGDDEEVAARTGGVILSTGGLGEAENTAKKDAFEALEGKKDERIKLRDDIQRLLEDG